MKTQIFMQVTVDVSTNENDTYLSDIERWVASHVKIASRTIPTSMYSLILTM